MIWCCTEYHDESNRGEWDRAINSRRVGGVSCLQSGLILDYARVWLIIPSEANAGVGNNNAQKRIV